MFIFIDNCEYIHIREMLSFVENISKIKAKQR